MVLLDVLDGKKRVHAKNKKKLRKQMGEECAHIFIYFFLRVDKKPPEQM